MSNDKKILQQEYNNIIENNWTFLNNTYKANIKNQYNRTKVSSYKNIKKIKEEVYEKLGAIPVFIFLTEICSYIKMPSPIFNIEKGIMLLKLMLDGCSISHLDIYEESNSFYKIYQSIFINNSDFLDNWLDNMLQNCFSNNLTRMLYSKINNPSNFQHCTLLLDGKHNRIIVEDIDLDKRDLYSYKLKKNALNTQFVIDSAGFLIYISESLPCKYNNDDNMLINNVNIMKFFKISDCMCFDGLYENVIQELIDKYRNIGLNIDLNNFCFPIRKEVNKELEYDESNFNNQLGSYRSMIESFFASFTNIFKRFGPYANVRITKEKTYNLQLKFCLVMFNIKNFVEYNNMKETSYFKMWMEDDFDFFNEINDFNITKNTQRVKYRKENIINMQNIQSDLLNKMISDINLNISKQKNKMDIDENITENNKEKSYEIQYIMKHRPTENGYEYLVKWKNYKKSKSSWETIDKFDTKDIIDKYWKGLEE